MSVIQELELMGFKIGEVREIPKRMKSFDHIEYKSFPLKTTETWFSKDGTIRVSIWGEMTNVISYKGETFSKFIPINRLIEFLNNAKNL